jgi:uncharacterized membrane protein
MKPFIVLILLFLISLVITRIFKNKVNYPLSGRVAMSVMLLFTALGHFMFPKGMAMIIPDFIPGKIFLVYLTGVIEITAAIGLLIPKLVKLTSWMLIAFFILVLPANIYAAIYNIDYQNANFEGPGLEYLWFRVPFQLLLIAWVYFCGIYYNSKDY